MIVEYFGISGVGKSTIAEEYYLKASEEHKNINWPRYRLYFQTKWMKRNLIKSFHVFCMAVLGKKWTKSINQIFGDLGIKGKDRLVLLFNFLSYKYMFAKCVDSECEYIFDEGVFQLIWAVCLRAKHKISPNQIKKLFQLYQVPDKLIVVEADTPIIISRLHKRGIKTRILETKDLKKSINVMKEQQDYIIKTSISLELIKQSCIEYCDNNFERRVL